jgi:5'-phosphate synthase pdxT subunit
VAERPDKPDYGQPGDDRRPPLVGVLALQGGFEAHAKILVALGARHREVRTVDDLAGLDALILPGGESTAITLAIEREQLAGPLRALAARGVPVLGTCAGLIMLDRDHLGILDVRVERNAFGRQLRSFETDLVIDELPGGPVRAVFIRAPWVDQRGAGVRVLAEIDGHPVAVRAGQVIALAFHPELSGETRLHQLLLDMIRTSG